MANRSAIPPRPLFGDITTFTLDSGDNGGINPFPAVQEYLRGFPAELNVTADYECVKRFLRSYSGKASTFKVYRSYVERLLLWSWIIHGKSVLDLVRSDAEEFMRFNKEPPGEWIGAVTSLRFSAGDNGTDFNKDWRPFSTQKKKAGDSAAYSPPPSTLQLVLACCSTFYAFAYSDGHKIGNPFTAIKQKKNFTGEVSSQRSSKALTHLEWDFLLETAELMADEDSKYERSLFIIVALFSMYLRIGDLAGNGTWKPTMGSFVRRGENWWYQSCGKGGKEASISVKPAFISYLKRYRASRNLPPLPIGNESAPLLLSNKGGSGLGARHIRTLVMQVFDRSLHRMREEGRSDEECLQLQSATVHWLRHTGATFDAPYRPAKHLQLDLRHGSLHTTQNIYYNSIDEERAASSRDLAIRK